MSQREEILESHRPAQATPARIGVVVHPSRAIDEPLAELRQWAGRHGVSVVQVSAPCQQRQIAAHGDVEACDLIVSIGGDGTMLAAMRAGVVAARPVLGVACGSLGALATVAANGVARALERFSRGDWVPRSLPALDIARDLGDQLFALNDVAIVRAGEGQICLTAHVDGTLFARIAGDGCVVSTPIGSSAYALAAGGPLVTPDMHAFVLTPLPTHGGSCPPLVVQAASEIRLATTPGHGGARLEIDGQVADTKVALLAIRFRPAVATVVAFADHEPFLTGLRRRQIVADSPRFLAEDALG